MIRKFKNLLSILLIVALLVFQVGGVYAQTP
ncbi:MAG: hypothetical protein UX19_C0009G0001, partial [Candidatus Woesebacteria bacterium GW2011_GWA1_45_8]